jgi:hypothetical protein
MLLVHLSRAGIIPQEIIPDKWNKYRLENIWKTYYQYSFLVRHKLISVKNKSQENWICLCVMSTIGNFMLLLEHDMLYPGVVLNDILYSNIPKLLEEINVVVHSILPLW